MTPTERSGDRHVALYVRESLPAPAAHRREGLRERLRELRAEGHVDGFEVVDCPKRIRREDPVDGDARDRYNEFSQWARDRGVCLSPFFGTRECYAPDTGEKGDWLVFPALTLAVYEDGDLAAVYPHADSEGNRSVADGLAALAETGANGSVSDDTPTPITTAD